MCLLDYSLFLVHDIECVYDTSAAAYIQSQHNLS